MAVMDKTALAVFIPSIWAKGILSQIRAKAKVLRLVARDYENEFASPGDTVKITKVGALTARNKAASTPVVRDAPANSSQDFLLDKHTYSAFMIEDIAKAQANPEVELKYTTEAARVLVTKAEVDLITAIYTGAGASVGAAGTAGSEALILDIREALDNSEVGEDQSQYALWATKDAKAFMTTASGKFSKVNESGSSEALRKATIGELYGVNHLKSTLVPVTAGAPNDTHCISWVPEAVQTAFRPLALPPTDGGVKAAYATDPETGITLRVTGQYSIDDMAMKVNVDLLWGVKVIRPEWVKHVHT
jgi:hypothetical protein